MKYEALKRSMDETAEKIERELYRLLKPECPEEARIVESMRYSVLGGGKRVRPFLLFAFAELFSPASEKQKAAEAAMPFALALEMIHGYSLIHDDLPCMDNDEMRRGKPSNHMVFGEAGAVLAGDGLLTKAFEVAADSRFLPPDRVLAGIRLLARSAGECGMVGGQTLDMENVGGKQLSLSQLDAICSRKTGALLRAACLLGSLCAGAEAEKTAAAERYGEAVGRLFQIVDDLLDATGESAVLGKKVGVDAENEKTTYLTLLGEEGCKREARLLAERAILAVKDYPDSDRLLALADYLCTRKA